MKNVLIKSGLFGGLVFGLLSTLMLYLATPKTFNIWGNIVGLFIGLAIFYVLAVIFIPDY